MKFNNSVRKEIIINNAPHGFSRMKHKKHTKKTVSQPLTLEDFKLMGKGAGAAAKAFLEGYKEEIGDK
ncbi:hypothetical protein [Lactococcus sp.]|uniref:hypothetical protein n=1 Tax=Lactococcus sp. TaxID=44273 RepID=UPI002FC7E466